MKRALFLAMACAMVAVFGLAPMQTGAVVTAPDEVILTVIDKTLVTTDSLATTPAVNNIVMTTQLNEATVQVVMSSAPTSTVAMVNDQDASADSKENIVESVGSPTLTTTTESTKIEVNGADFANYPNPFNDPTAMNVVADTGVEACIAS